MLRFAQLACLILAGVTVPTAAAADEPGRLSIAWKDNFLTIHGAHLPGGELQVQYLEAYCRPGSQTRDWGETVIKHRTQLVSAGEDRRRIELVCRLDDGVRVEHQILARDDEIEFHLTATNPTRTRSQAHWAQPCIRVAEFTGRGQQDYLPHCFVFIDGTLTRLPTEPWATEARYVPGQVYCPRHVDRADVNPRPLSDLVPSNGLCGCFSADGKLIMATAWEPYQELFQGVAVCMHADFRLGAWSPVRQSTSAAKSTLWKRTSRPWSSATSAISPSTRIAESRERRAESRNAPMASARWPGWREAESGKNPMASDR